MPPAARGTASPWFTGRAQKPADGEVSLTTGQATLADQGRTKVAGVSDDGLPSPDLTATQN